MSNVLPGCERRRKRRKVPGLLPDRRRRIRPIGEEREKKMEERGDDDEGGKARPNMNAHKTLNKKNNNGSCVLLFKKSVAQKM